MIEIVHLFEPIGIISVVLFILILYELLIKKHKHGAIITSLALVTFLSVSTPLGANWLIRLVEITESSDRQCAGQLPIPVVILAGGIDNYPQNNQQFWYLTQETIRRTMQGLEFASSLEIPILVLAGGGGQAIRESDLMKTMALNYGYPESKILIERRSNNTYENSINVARQLGKNKHIWIVTSALHMRRALATFEKQEYEVCIFPVNIRWQDVPFPNFLIPQVDALTKSTETVHEILGLAWYYFTGKA